MVTNELLIPKKLDAATAERDIEFEAAIPDYRPDAKRIVKADCTPYAEKCEMSEGKITVTGRAVFDILYESDKNCKLQCCIFTKDFSLSANCKSDIKNARAECDPKCLRVSFDLLNPRKIFVRATLSGGVTVFGDHPVKSILAESGNGIYCKTKEICCDKSSEYIGGEFKFSETLPLARTEKSVSDIVYSEISVSRANVLLSGGRAEMKADAEIFMLCEDEENEGGFFASSKTIPISIELQNDMISEDCFYDSIITVVEKDISPELDRYGESRNVKIDFTLRAGIHVTAKETFTVAEDVFEQDYTGEPVFSSASLINTVSAEEKSFTVETVLPPLAQSVTEICSCKARKISFSAKNTEDGMNFGGSFAVDMIAKTENGYYEVSGQIPFEQTVARSGGEGVTSDADAYPIELTANLRGDGSIGLRLVIGVSVKYMSVSEEKFVSDIIKRAEIKSAETDNDIVYYFPSEGETLWSVAKRYRVAPNDIASDNEGKFLDNGVIAEKGVPLLIRG